jgi:hypothetical protein
MLYCCEKEGIAKKAYRAIDATAEAAEAAIAL